MSNWLQKCYNTSYRTLFAAYGQTKCPPDNSKKVTADLLTYNQQDTGISPEFTKTLRELECKSVFIVICFPEDFIWGGGCKIKLPSLQNKDSNYKVRAVVGHPKSI